MYINLKNIEAAGFEVGDLLNLYLIFQAYREDEEIHKKMVTNLIKTERVHEYKALGLVTFIKGRKSDPRWKKLRLSKEGKELIKKFTEEPITKEAEEAFSFLSGMYKEFGQEDKVVYPSKTKEYLQSFMNETGYDLRHIKAAIREYFEKNDDKNFLLSSKNLIFKPENAYAQKFKLKDSPLWGFIQVNLKA